MPFTTTIESIRAKILAKDERQRIKDEKTILKYRAIINDRLRSMSTTEECVFFRNGKVYLLERIADELIEAGFRAIVYNQHLSYPEGVRLFIRIPTNCGCDD